MVAALAVVIALAVTPTAGDPLVLAPIDINVSPGQQVDPHVDGDVAAYTDFGSSAQIRYYDFSTGADQAIPTDGNRDQLSDVDTGRVVFTRIFSDGHEAVMLFDTATTGPATEINAAAGSARSAVAIGGNTLAYIDQLLTADGTGEVVVWDLASSTATRLTTDGNIDQAPSVSPDGKVVVWERCPPTSLSNCDVQMAVNGAGGWTVSDVAATLAPEGYPNTNGTVVVYTAHNGTDYDIYWRDVAGGPTSQLELAGNQVHPSIAGDVIAFEGLAVDGVSTDLFIYHLSDGKLYQLTDTPLVNESLNDVTVLADESVRVVWQANDGSDGMNDIHGATFQLPGVTPTDGGTVDPPDGGGDCGRGRGHHQHGNGHGWGHEGRHCHGDHHRGDWGHCGGDDDDGHADGGVDDDHHDGEGGGGSGQHGHHHKRASDTASVRQALSPDEPTPVMGCTSTGSTAVPVALASLALLLLLRRVPNRAEARRRRR